MSSVLGIIRTEVLLSYRGIAKLYTFLQLRVSVNEVSTYHWIWFQNHCHWQMPDRIIPMFQNKLCLSFLLFWHSDKTGSIIWRICAKSIPKKCNQKAKDLDWVQTKNVWPITLSGVNPISGHVADKLIWSKLESVGFHSFPSAPLTHQDFSLS